MLYQYSIYVLIRSIVGREDNLLYAFSRRGDRGVIKQWPYLKNWLPNEEEY